MRKNLMPLAAVLLLSTPWLAAAADPATPPRYSIKQDHPDVGSHILREAVTSDLPMNKPYGELTPEQRLIVKSQYEGMASDDEPPYPLNGPRSLYKAMSSAQDKLHVSGKLSLIVDVDSSGQPTAVSMLSSPDPELTRFAAAVLITTKYKPARCKGEPCAMQFPFRINFTLR